MVNEARKADAPTRTTGRGHHAQSRLWFGPKNNIKKKKFHGNNQSCSWSSDLRFKFASRKPRAQFCDLSMAVSYRRTVYAFTNETLTKYSYATSLQVTLRYGIMISLVQGLGLGFTYGLAICSCALQLWVRQFLVAYGKARGGDIIAALFAIILSGVGLYQAATNFSSIDHGRIAADRLSEMISQSPSVGNNDGLSEMISQSPSIGNTLVSVQGNIEFRNVYFSYLSRPEIPILSGFYLSVPAKKAVALVGRNRSGKSSIIPLMERFYDPTLGEVVPDGVNIKNLKLESLRRKIGLVTQEPALLSLSIRDNIAYGHNASSDEIEEAAKGAHAHIFISSLEKGYETQVGRAGLELTKEQKIRIAIARVMLLRPSILLLDDVTGGIDFEAEKAVQEVLDLLVLGRSTIIIARCVIHIRNADYIAVMEKGQLVEMGTHDELVTLDGLYVALLKCEEAAKPPMRNYKKTAVFQIERDSSVSHSFQEAPSPKKMIALQRVPGLHGVQPQDVIYNLQESPKTGSPLLDQTSENGTFKRQDDLEMRLPQLPKKEVQPAQRQKSNSSDPESPVSPFLTSDPKNERSHSQTFSRPLSESDDVSIKGEDARDKPIREAPSFWRLVELSFSEWLYAVLGSTGAAGFGSLNPLLAYVIALIVAAYYRPGEGSHLQQEVDKWCLVITCMGVVTVVANCLQHFYYGIMGEKMTEQVRRMMFSGEYFIFVFHLSFVQGSTWYQFNRLSLFVQDTAAVIAAVLIGMLLHWRLALVAMATLPILMISALAQVSFCPLSTSCLQQLFVCSS
ncbi:hypothetical protein EUGRSUZ_G02906 [Eucalyptus grandis]|uniref:ABC transporter domain-containing protein n=2 Tax=Eucalyptus grandis TaxID=71139 RepID=A0A059BHK3_EUCGR|nr:hypothetical protein EUGRSUZ_G02906 [Eucalyptus grandis]